MITIPKLKGREINEAILIELLEVFSVDERIPANAINRRPPIKSAIPPIIIKIAMIVTPIGLFVFVFEFKLISKDYRYHNINTYFQNI